MIVIINYGMGNIASVFNMLKKAGTEAVISNELCVIEKASKLILPGVGTFDRGMRNLSEMNLIPLLTRKVIEQRVPILGICLGVQLFTKRSEEGQLPGLGWIDAETVRFRPPPSLSLKIPHMGWNTVKPAPQSRLFREAGAHSRYYFVHSYHVRCEDAADVAATSEHGYEFTAAVERANIFGTQFHPEKSHRYGLQLMRNFSAIPGDL